MIKLDARHKKEIKNWIDLSIEVLYYGYYDMEDICPFHNLVHDCPGHYVVCDELFPLIKGRSAACPCHLYSLNDVISRAKKAIKGKKEKI